MKNRYRTSFKFHYVSINSIVSRSLSHPFTRFKFHYVSINSRLFGAKYNLYLSTLNSIMFLLIPTSNLDGNGAHSSFKFHYVSINSLFPKSFLQILSSLNSIMFLLILVCILICVVVASVFKFHYVSINSI